MNTLFILAVKSKLRNCTKKTAKETLKAAGFKQSLCDEFLSEIENLADLRKNAFKNRIARKIGHSNFNFSKVLEQFLKPADFLRFNIDSRLNSFKIKKELRFESLVVGIYKDALRFGVNDEIGINIVDNPIRVGVLQTEEISWNQYRGQFKNWGMKYKNTTIFIPASYRERVIKNNLEIVDGMMTLDASKIECDGAELFAAKWLVQGRGNNVECVSGFIARGQGVCFHGDTAEKALKGLHKKQKQQSIESGLGKISPAQLGEFVEKNKHIIVKVSDARATGACEYGIKSWCAAVGLDYETGSATLQDVYECYCKRPMIEARAVILHVLRKRNLVV